MPKSANKETNMVSDNPLVQTIEVKYKYTDNELLGFSRELCEAYNIITAKELELKQFSSAIKEEKEIQEDIIADRAFKINAGYEMKPVQCTVKYDNGIVTFTNKENGEIMEQRPITEEEQLRLNSNWVDAEKVIRDDSEKEE